MLIRLLNSIRCRIAGRILRSDSPLRYAVSRRLAPDTTSLISHRRRQPPALKLPPRSHLIYHQGNVDALAVANSLASLAPQLPPEDEVFFLDVGATGDPAWLEPFGRHEWTTYSACQARHPEQQSYTFGLNSAMAGLKAPHLFVWRTDYVYPPGVVARYREVLTHARFASPYWVLVGLPEIDSAFVRRERARLDPFDEPFWAARSRVCSLYESQDPALFAIERKLWEKIGGLNHELWGYGWQFAEFAARLRAACPDSDLAYFACSPPVHQTHTGSQMFEPAALRAEAEAGHRRFRDFLGGDDAYTVYRTFQHLPSRPPV